MSGKGIFMYNAPISYITMFLESFGKFVPNLPAVNETGLSDKYDIVIPFYTETPDQFFVDLEKLGLKVIEAEREIEMIILYEEKDTNKGDYGNEKY